ncbi:MAG: dihydropteroate synthase [Flavobacteriaceae bacterium]
MTINCKGVLIPLSSPKIMGILNLTPDSFFDGGKYTQRDVALKQCEKLLLEGADFIDLGAYSSKPGAAKIDDSEEYRRLIPVLEALIKRFPEALFSIDTFRSSIAQAALDRGAAMVNDISAGRFDPDMLTVVGRYDVPYVAMHMQGQPQTMQNQPHYDDLISEIWRFFSEKIRACHAAGINDVLLDPGFGFGKTIAHNYTLLNKLERFKEFETPILVGVSRKSMIHKLLEIKPEEALNGTSVLHTIALQKGAHILRVHDVKEAKECVALVQHLQ